VANMSPTEPACPLTRLVQISGATSISEALAEIEGTLAELVQRVGVHSSKASRRETPFASQMNPWRHRFSAGSECPQKCKTRR